MADTRQDLTLPEVPSTESDHSNVIDLCSDSSGDKGPPADRPSVDSDATLSEANDAGTAAAGLQIRDAIIQLDIRISYVVNRRAGTAAIPPMPKVEPG